MGTHRPDGYEYKSANGYWYRKVNGSWKLISHLVAAEKLGRPVASDERVTFKDKDPDNLAPDNIVITKKKGGKAKRIETIKAHILRLQEELEELEAR